VQLACGQERCGCWHGGIRLDQGSRSKRGHGRR
jgi:hypothetical protein